MREILFRGKTFAGQWIEGFLFQMCGDCAVNWCISKTPICANDYSDILGDWAEVIPETIGQYTGLTDKNGKKIFEGDIVHYLYEPGKGYWNSDQNSVIQWKTTGFYMCGIMGTNKYACSSGWLVSTPHGDGKCFEIIGNIHDNPELLKGETK